MVAKNYLTKNSIGDLLINASKEEKDLWIVKSIDNVYGEKKAELYFIYTGIIEVPDVIECDLYTAKHILNEKGFSNVSYKTVDGSSVWLETNWVVLDQSVNAGKKIQATERILLTCESYENHKTRDKHEEKASSNHNDQIVDNNTNEWVYEEWMGEEFAPTSTATRRPEKKVSYSTNTKNTVKKGNCGIYSYISNGPKYEKYYIIDFDKGYVYFFIDGNGNDSCERTKIVSGSLNDVLMITYHDGSVVWSYGLHFKWKNQPDHLVVQDNYGFEDDYYPTDLDDALSILRSKRIIDY